MAQPALALSESIFDSTKVHALLDRGVRDGVFPGCSVVVGISGQILFTESVGSAGAVGEPAEAPQFPMNELTVFDVANITQTMVTNTILMQLLDEGRLDLNHRVSRYLPGFNILGKSPITIGHLLSHTSGLAATAPFFEELSKENSGARLGILTSKGARDYIITQITRSSLKFEPGSRQQYSELGFILLGHLIELLTGLALEKAALKYVFQPFGLKSTSYVDLSMIRRRGIHPVTELIAPTEECGWRKKLLWGEVHDENAWAMGGIAGHSGLFSSASDTHRFASYLLKSYQGKGSYLSRAAVKQFFEGGTFAFPTTYKFGWEAPGRENGLDETGLSERAVGVNGFTGCSLWLEPEKNLSIVMMSNRVHPNRNNKKIQAFRAELHKLIISSL